MRTLSALALLLTVCGCGTPEADTPEAGNREAAKAIGGAICQHANDCDELYFADVDDCTNWFVGEACSTLDCDADVDDPENVDACIAAVETQSCTSASLPTECNTIFFAEPLFFTLGRTSNPCTDSVPVCDDIAACVLSSDQYLHGLFPGGQRLIVPTEIDQAHLITRFLLVEQRYAGTEILVRAYSTDCGDYDEGHAEGVDLFELAGDDGIIEYGLDVSGLGDHMVELYSDMSADFMFRIDIGE